MVVLFKIKYELRYNLGFVTFIFLSQFEFCHDKLFVWFLSKFSHKLELTDETSLHHQWHYIN